MRVLDHAALARGLGPKAALDPVRRRLHCTPCGARDIALYRARVAGQNGSDVPASPETSTTKDGGLEPPGAGP